MMTNESVDHSTYRNNRARNSGRGEAPVMDILNRVLSVIAVVTAPVMTLLVDTHSLSPQTATDIGSVIAALVVGWHGGSIVQQNRSGNSAKISPPISGAAG